MLTFSIIFQKNLKIPDISGTAAASSTARDLLQVPDAHQNVRSPHRYSVHSQDIDLPDTVANFVDFVKEGRHTRHRYRHNMHTRYRGKSVAQRSLNL